MSFWAETGQITSPAGTGNQAYTFSGAGNGLVPKAIIFFASFIAAGSTGADDHRMVGFTTGATAARNQCHCSQNQDGVGTVNRIYGFSETSCIFKNDDNATTVDLAAVLVSFDTDGFTLNWTTTASGVNIQYIALGGDALEAYADNFDIAAATGNQSATGVPFQPKALITLWSRANTTSGSFVSEDAGLGIGVAVSSSARWIWAGFGDDGALTNEAYDDISDNVCYKVFTEGTGGIEGEGDFVAFTSDGFTVNRTNATVAAFTLSYLALGGNIQVAAGTETAPTSATTKATNVGFDPQFVMLAGVNSTAVDNDAFAAEDRAASLGFGVPSADSRCCFWIEDNASDPIDCNSGASATKCISIRSPTAIGTVLAEADIDASASNSFVLNWTTAATAHIFGYLAIAEAVTALTPADLVQVVNIDNVTARQLHLLSTSSLTALVELDSAIVRALSLLTVQDLVQAVVLDSSSISQVTPLTVADLVQLVVIDSVDVAQTYPKPTLVAIGTRATALSSTTLSVPYPANIEANDYLVLYILDNPGNTDNPTTPDGWELLSNADLGGTGEHFVYRKVADGTETGNLDVTVASDAQGQIGYITHYKGPAGCRWFEEFLSTSTGSDATVEISSITASGPMRLGVSYLGIPQTNNSFGDVSGETGGTWAEQLDEGRGSAPTGTVALETADITTRTTISGGTSTTGTNRWTQTTWVIGCDVPEAMPYQAAAGAGATAESPATSISVPYPGGIVAGDLLVIQLFRYGTGDNDPNTPAGWQKKHEDDTTSAGQAQFVYYKEADGTETGSLSITGLSASTAGYFARMYRFVVDAASWGLEGGATTNGSNSSTVSMPSLVTTAANRLGLAFFSSAGQNAPVSSTGESGGDWLEELPDFSSAIGNDAVIQLQTAEMASADTISGGSFSDGGNDAWVVRTFAIYGTVAATTLVAQDLVQLVVLDTTALAQHHMLTTQDLVEAVILDNVTLTQLHRLIAADLVQLVVIDNLTLVLVSNLVAQDLVQVVVLDTSALTQHHMLLAGNLSQDVVLDNATLRQLHALISQGLIEDVVLDTTNLTQLHKLLVDSLEQLVVLDNVTLTIAGVLQALVVQDLIVELVLSYCTQAVLFDSTDFVYLSDLSNVVDGPLFSAGIYFKPSNLNSREIIRDDGWINITFDTTDITVTLFNSTFSRSFVFKTTNPAPLSAGQYVHLAVSANTGLSAGNKIGTISFNGVAAAVTVTSDADPAFDIPWDSQVATLAVGSFGAPMLSDVVDAWIDDSFISDHSRFYTPGYGLNYLGENGIGLTGRLPIYFASGDAAAFIVNKGRGGSFSVFGTITDATSDPPCNEPYLEVFGFFALTVQDLTQLVTLDNATLSQHHQLLNSDLTVQVVLDNVPLLQFHQLSSQDLTQFVVLDNVDVRQIHMLSVQELVEAVVLDNVTLSQQHLLTTNDLVEVVTLDNVTLQQLHLLLAQGLIEEVVLDNTTLSQLHALLADGLVEDVVLDNVTLALFVAGFLAVQDLVVQPVLDNVGLTQLHLITSNDLVEVVVLDNVTLGVLHTLTSQDLTQLVVLDNTTLSQQHNLVATDLAQLVVIDTTTMDQHHLLVIQGLVEDVFLDNSILQQLHGLIPDDLILPVVLDTVSLTQLHLLTATDLVQEVYLDAVPGELEPGGFGTPTPGQQRLFVSGDRTIIIVRGTDALIVAPQRDSLVSRGNDTTIVVSNEEMEV